MESYSTNKATEWNARNYFTSLEHDTCDGGAELLFYRTPYKNLAEKLIIKDQAPFIECWGSWHARKKGNSAVDLEFSVLAGFFDELSGNTKSLNMTGVYLMYSSSMSTVITNRWSQRWLSKEMKEFEAEVCKHKKGSWEPYLSCTHQRHVQ